MRKTISYDEYLAATAMTLARRHRPLWCRGRCVCGSTLPCRVRHRPPISRAHWPSPEEAR
ncbi:hypothetical protein O7627_31115 [Solwaraspora sp. WMMD1047]|uniref:hypothetical protein n=1 Tax=Solwaraspora sp. WMMD1047 TaxID=3016102 RepID=UPI002415C85C|nr:hypothetical protein [Solwaraspora sp. WMMD1047]MDG4833730.1 hypothetical protein [Solwaraspora sp. WMMD1047]